MKRIEGSDRTVFVGERMVVKLPNHQIGLAGKELLRNFMSYGHEALILAWGMSAEQHQSPKWFALHGLIANRRESRLAKTYPDVVVSTLSLGCGLANVQPRLGPIQATAGTVWDSFYELLGQDTPKHLGHMLENTDNLGICEDGMVRFTDGGSQGLEHLLDTGKGDLIAKALHKIFTSPTKA